MMSKGTTSNQTQALLPIEDSEISSLMRQLCFLGGVTLQRVEGPADWYLRASAPEGSIVLGKKHLEWLRFPLPPLVHQFFSLTGIHPMQLNANGIMILMGLSALSVLLNIQIDLEVVFYAYKLTIISKKSSYPTFYLQPLPGCHISGVCRGVISNETPTPGCMRLEGRGALLG